MITFLNAKISAGVTGEDGPDFKDGKLPPSFEAAMEPYVKKGAKAGSQICKNLSPLIRAVLLPENLSYWKKIFKNTNDINATSVVVTGFYFDGSTNLPDVTAEAVFEVDLKSGVNAKLIEELESDGELLGDAINFYWEFEDNPIEDWDGSLVNNSGIEGEIIY
jgi:hypothetical protein